LCVLLYVVLVSSLLSRRSVCFCALRCVLCKIVLSSAVLLTLWRPLLPNGYSYKASCAGLSRAPFLIFDIWALWRSALSKECTDVRNYKWWLNLLWHRMLSSCTHTATVGVKGLIMPDTVGTIMRWFCLFIRSFVCLGQLKCKLFILRLLRNSRFVVFLLLLNYHDSSNNGLFCMLWLLSLLIQSLDAVVHCCFVVHYCSVVTHPLGSNNHFHWVWLNLVDTSVYLVCYCISELFPDFWRRETSMNWQFSFLPNQTLFLPGMEALVSVMRRNCWVFFLLMAQ